MEAMKAAELEALEGPLQRHEITHDDHPLSLGSKSVWHQFFQVCVSLHENINFMQFAMAMQDTTAVELASEKSGGC